MTTPLTLPPVPFTKTFAQIVSDYTAAAQAASLTPLDFTVGSVFLALAEASAGNADWLQKLYLFALLVSRLQTSQGIWVDTFCADYMPAVPGTNSPRLPAVPATGGVTFSRNNPQSQVVIPVGALVATFDGSQVYQVFADATNLAYSATIIPGGGFIVPAGTASLIVNVIALNPGTQGNALTNTITLIRSSVVGIDAVTNAAPLTTGIDQESDDALKARFKLFILSLRAGTEGAIGFAIVSLQQGMTYAIHENVDPNGAPDIGAVTIYIDDGSGSPPSSLVLSALTAVNNIRAAGVRAEVIGATKILANIQMTIVTATGYDHPTLVAAVANAVGAFVADLAIEQELPFSMLEHVAYNASAGVINVTNVTLNGGTSDFVPAAGQTIRVGTLTVQ